MTIKKTAVEVGIKFENNALRLLKECGLEAWRTNKANPDDPEQYKAGFDGGVDIIARYSISGTLYKDYVFYIQCKCQKNSLTKSAISEVYAGMHARDGFSTGSIPVVMASGTATAETIQFANSLGVELILDKEIGRLSVAREFGEIEYDNYGILMKILLYHYTKDKSLLDTIPDTIVNIDNRTIKQELLEQTTNDLNMIQSEWDSIARQELRLQQKRQKTLDKTKVVMFRNIQASDYSKNSHEKHVKSDKPTIDMDSG